MDTRAEGRRRGAETRRRRTREALIVAARERFAAYGWPKTRVEDIARDAEVGVATAFTHFTKHSLLGYAYAPLLTPITDKAQGDVASQRDPVESLTRHVHDLASLCRTQQNLTNALLVAVQEQSLRAPGPPDPDDEDDIRAIVPMPVPMIQLVEYGQRARTFRRTPEAEDVGIYHTNALAIMTATRPRRTAEEIASMVLSQLLPGLLGK